MLSAAKWGALVGVAIYLVSQVITFVDQVALGAGPADLNHPGKITLGCLELLLIAFAFSASGFYTGRETRVAGYGAIAGMVTFVVYGALISIYSFGGRIHLGADGATLGEQIVIELIVVILYLIISALIGWLGGRPGAAQGRARANRLAAAQAQAHDQEPANK
ncbi:MAG TPA: hypothetical protein VFX31_06935 [Ktedonobacterales bacterium]|nr:hypothetical protein [Ktedonobacterales bacterium]HEX5571101.1 hypothetical protein [Ktedonobacterales bacterium]